MDKMNRVRPDRLQEAAELVNAYEQTPGDAPRLRDLLAWAVAEIEGLREREGYAGAHVELLQQLESEAVCRLAEARVRLEMLECQVVALRQAQLRGEEGA